MRQFYTLPALKNKKHARTKKASKSYFGIFVTFARHALLKLSHNMIKVFDTLQKKCHTLSLLSRWVIRFPKDFDCSSIDLI